MNNDTNSKYKNKTTFAGISFSSINTVESAAAIIDENFKIISMQKLNSYHDVEFWLKNLQGVKNTLIAVSIPKNEIMISNKWKYASRVYHAVNLNSKIKNRDGWARRYSKKGVELFKELKSEGYDIFRYETSNVKQKLACNEAYTERTPADCKALQTAIKYKLKVKDLPHNMIPVAQLEAILGAFTAAFAFQGSHDIKKLFEYGSLDVLGFE